MNTVDVVRTRSRPGSAAGWAVPLGLAAVAVFAWATDMPLTLLLPVVALAALAVTAVLVEISRTGDFLTGTGMAALAVLAFFVLRPVTIWAQNRTSPGAIADQRPVRQALEGPMADAALAVLVFFICAFATVWILRSRRPRITVRPASADLAPHRSAALVLVTALAASAALGALVLSSGGPSAYLSQLANRSSYLSGSTYLTLGYIPVVVAVVVHVIACREVGRAPGATALFGSAAAVGVAMFSGGRGPVILGVVLPLLVLKQLGPKPFRLRTLVTATAALAFSAVAYAIVLRDSTFAGKSAREGLYTNPLGTVTDRLLDGGEFQSFDSLIRLFEASGQSGFQFASGSTYFTAPWWFVPRGLAADKPFGGGNTWFTENFVPRFYGSDRVETSISVVGEAFGNFGWVAVPVVGMAFGAVLWLLGRRHATSAFRAAAIVLLTPMIWSWTRSDLFHNLGTGVAALLLAALFLALCHTRHPAEPGGRHRMGPHQAATDTPTHPTITV